jgi:Zn-dependent peptidase ImmA (M78 family)/transcriptional regulator with XRE-family HTH domain
MSAIDSNSFNPQVLTSLRQQLSYAADEVADLLGIALSRFNEIENGTTAPSSKELNLLAHFFRVQDFNFYRKNSPKKSSDINFRTALPGYKGEPGPILDAVSFATSIQSLLESVSDLSQHKRERPKRDMALTSDAEFEASWWRDKLPLETNVQLSIDSNDKFFTYFRSRIEDNGISVLVSSFEEKFLKGLVLGSGKKIPVILINSYRQSKSSRSFTLAHEFCHLLLGKDGVSNPYDADTKLERFCNRFAAALLMPRSVITELLNGRHDSATSNTTIKWLANKLKVSLEAVVIRLVECGYAEASFWKVWKSQFEARGYLPSEEPKKGGGAGEEGPDQGIVKLAYFGFLFGRLIPDQLSKSGISKMTVFKASRLKPHYISALGEATKQRLLEVQSYGRA